MTSSGLVIPDTAKEKPVEGTVVAVGPGRSKDGSRGPPRRGGRRHRHLLQVRRHRGQGRSGDEYLILSARDVLAVVGK